MADRLYLSVWFPTFPETEMMPRLLSVLRQFPFAARRPGVGYLGVHSVSFSEPMLFQHGFDYSTDPERALALAADFIHSDNAYELELMLDLCVPLNHSPLDHTSQFLPPHVPFFPYHP